MRRISVSLALLLSCALAACDETHAGVGLGKPCQDDDSCATGLACVSGVCALAESHVTCEAGTRRCDGSRVLGCAADGASEGLVAICDDGCRDGACIEVTCVPGTEKCQGDEVVRCRTSGAGFELARRCELGCDPAVGACRAPVCRPGERRCAAGGKAFESCDARGSGWVATDCSVATSGKCVVDVAAGGARCEAAACVAGARRCDGAVVVACLASGSGETIVERCASGCAGGACVAPACATGQRRCDGSTVLVCAADRSGFVVAESCAGACVGSPGTPRCKPAVCAPLQVRCGASGVERCRTDGSGFEALAACAPSEACVAGACVAQPATACTPGARRCSGLAIEECTEGTASPAFTAIGSCLGRCIDGGCDSAGSCTPLRLDLALVDPTEQLPGDGVSSFLVVSRPITDLVGGLVADGTEVTVSATGGGSTTPVALLATDADRDIPGTQVRVKDGRIDFAIRAAFAGTGPVTATVEAFLPGRPSCAATLPLRFKNTAGDHFVADDFLTTRARDASKGGGATWDTEDGTLSVGSFDAGDGRDGPLVVTASQTVDLGTRLSGGRRFPDMASEKVTEIKGDLVIVPSGAEAFEAGARVLLVNVRGGAAGTSQVGTWELGQVAGLSQGALRLTQAPLRRFGDPDNSAAGLSSQSVRIVRLPQYASVSIDGNVTGPAFDGTSGGILGFFAKSAATTGTGRNRIGATGAITMRGRGYRGASAPSSPLTPLTGESVAGGRDTVTSNRNVGGGGGGYQCGNGDAPDVAPTSPPPGNESHAFFGSAGSHATTGASTCDRAGQTYGEVSAARLTFGSGSGSQHESVYFACPQHKECCTQYKACRCDQYNSCCRLNASCCRQYNTCCTQYQNCCYQYNTCCTLYNNCENCDCGSSTGACTKCGFLKCARTCRTPACGCETSTTGAVCGCAASGRNIACGCEPGANKPDPSCGCSPGFDGRNAACGCEAGYSGPHVDCGCALPLARDVQCGCEPGAFKRDAFCGCEPREDTWKAAYAGAAGGGLIFIIAAALDMGEAGAIIDASGEAPATGPYGGAGGSILIRAGDLRLSGAGKLTAVGGPSAGAGRVFLETGSLDTGFVPSWTSPAATRASLDLPAAWSSRLLSLVAPDTFRSVTAYVLPAKVAGVDGSSMLDPAAIYGISDAEVSVWPGLGSYRLLDPAASVAVDAGETPTNFAWRLGAAPGAAQTRVRGLAFRIRVAAP